MHEFVHQYARGHHESVACLRRAVSERLVVLSAGHAGRHRDRRPRGRQLRRCNARVPCGLAYPQLGRRSARWVATSQRGIVAPGLGPNWSLIAMCGVARRGCSWRRVAPCRHRRGARRGSTRLAPRTPGLRSSPRETGLPSRPAFQARWMGRLGEVPVLLADWKP